MEIGIFEALVTFLYILVFGFFWRVATLMIGDTPVGRAMTFIY